MSWITPFIRVTGHLSKHYSDVDNRNELMTTGVGEDVCDVPMQLGVQYANRFKDTAVEIVAEPSNMTRIFPWAFLSWHSPEENNAPPNVNPNASLTYDLWAICNWPYGRESSYSLILNSSSFNTPLTTTSFLPALEAEKR
ncbi:hypothetical protein EVAR_4268_1 [Eumeta japonica]|uniref:Uncharacterized protein n=1 Tax=Eumeta variegata TaxID=151549 RepID=A0A4C1Z9F9_EUMVA|nr:hypothetical protein EVAR_4268_1 [Eumeta japonica]